MIVHLYTEDFCLWTDEISDIYIHKFSQDKKGYYVQTTMFISALSSVKNLSDA